MDIRRQFGSYTHLASRVGWMVSQAFVEVYSTHQELLLGEWASVLIRNMIGVLPLPL